MLEPEVTDSKLRIVAEFEADYERKAFELELAEKDKALAEKDNEIKFLKAKLKENGSK